MQTHNFTTQDTFEQYFESQEPSEQQANVVFYDDNSQVIQNNVNYDMNSMIWNQQMQQVQYPVNNTAVFYTENQVNYPNSEYNQKQLAQLQQLQQLSQMQQFNDFNQMNQLSQITQFNQFGSYTQNEQIQGIQNVYNQQQSIDFTQTNSTGSVDTNNYFQHSQETLQTNQTGETLETTQQETTSTNPDEYDANNVKDVDRMIKRIETTPVFMKGKKLTKSKLEKQKQKAKRTSLNAFIIFKLCQRGYKFETKRRQKESLGVKTIQIAKIIDPNNNIICTWEQVDKYSKTKYPGAKSRTEPNIIYMLNYMLDLYKMEYEQFGPCLITYGKYKKTGNVDDKMFITRNVDSIYELGTLYDQETLFNEGFYVFNLHFRDVTEPEIIEFH